MPSSIRQAGHTVWPLWKLWAWDHWPHPGSLFLLCISLVIPNPGKVTKRTLYFHHWTLFSSFPPPTVRFGFLKTQGPEWIVPSPAFCFFPHFLNFPESRLGYFAQFHPIVSVVGARQFACLKSFQLLLVWPWESPAERHSGQTGKCGEFHPWSGTSCFIYSGTYSFVFVFPSKDSVIW